MSSTSSSTRTFMPGKQPQEPAPKVRRQLPRPKLGKQVIWFAVIVVAVAAIFFALQYRESQSKKGAVGQQYFAVQTDRLSKLIILPVDETPTIITVKDAAKLREQEFYAQAQNGDLVFVYKKAQKAVLYRPSTNIIVNVMPVKVSLASRAVA